MTVERLAARARNVIETIAMLGPGVRYSVGSDEARAILSALDEARKQGAREERARITARWRLNHDTNRDKPEHRHPWTWCENARCVEARALLAEPPADEASDVG